MTNLESILKSRDITFRTKFHIVKAMVFQVVMYGCESWTFKKAEHWGIHSFELWCWRLLWVPWSAGRSILKEINTEYSLEGLMLNLQYFGYVMPRAESLERTLMLGKSEGRRRKEATENKIVACCHWLNGHKCEQILGGSEGQRSLVCPWGHMSQIWLSDWTTTKRKEILVYTTTCMKLEDMPSEIIQ